MVQYETKLQIHFNSTVDFHPCFDPFAQRSIEGTDVFDGRGRGRVRGVLTAAGGVGWPRDSHAARRFVLILLVHHNENVQQSKEDWGHIADFQEFVLVSLTRIHLAPPFRRGNLSGQVTPY